MSDEEGAEGPDAEAQRRRLRLVGYGISASGVLTLLVDAMSAQPQDILVVGLAGLALATLVLSMTEGSGAGLSLGFLTGSFGVWLWPHLDGGSHLALGLMLIGAGAANAVLTPYFHGVGERLADR